MKKLDVYRGKILLDRIVAMLTKLGGRGYIVRENGIPDCSEMHHDHPSGRHDSDSETDTDIYND